MDLNDREKLASCKQWEKLNCYDWLKDRFTENLHALTEISGYYKRNRHFQRYVVSKPLA